MRRERRFPLLLLLAVLAAPAAAHADDIDVSLVDKALEGKSKPALVLKAGKAVKRVRARLTRGDGKAVSVGADAVLAGRTVELALETPAGTHHYAGTLEVEFADGTGGELPLSFDVTVRAAPKIVVPYERLDLKASSLELQMTGPAGRCEYGVLFDGKPDRAGVRHFAGEQPGTWLRLGWEPHGPDDVVLRIALTCHDADGFYSALELFPWKLEIPHEDVTFPTGKWEIEAEEAPKLDRALADIDTALRRYGRVIQVRLFVAGHTDTVGDAASNRALSQQRARAIAAYFRKKGVKVPILFAGFGEDRLAVATPDETDERANRRAEYTVSVEEPIRASWLSL